MITFTFSYIDEPTWDQTPVDSTRIDNFCQRVDDEIFKELTAEVMAVHHAYDDAMSVVREGQQ